MAIEKSKNIFEDSKNGSVGARIKVLLDQLQLPVNGLEEKGGIGNGTLKGWKDKDLDFSSNVLSSFLTKLNVNKEWWQTGKGEIFNEKPTPAISTGSLDEAARGAMWTELIERNSEYSLIPKMVLRDYKMIPNVILSSHEQEIHRQDSLIAKYEKLIATYENDIARLRSQLVPKKAKK